MSEAILVGVFLWSIAQGDGIEAVVLAIRWAWMLRQYIGRRERERAATA
jgi:hypothetical protein